MCVHEISASCALTQVHVRIDALLYPEGGQISYCHTATAKGRGNEREEEEGLMVETVIDCPMVWIISEGR